MPEGNPGMCYKTAMEYLCDQASKFKYDSPKQKLLSLVHGLITLDYGPLEGKEFAHAWVEKGTKVIDKSAAVPVRMSVKKYYASLHAKVLKRYSVDEARKMVFQSGHFGPWE